MGRLLGFRAIQLVHLIEHVYPLHYCQSGNGKNGGVGRTAAVTAFSAGQAKYSPREVHVGQYSFKDLTVTHQRTSPSNSSIPPADCPQIPAYIIWAVQYLSEKGTRQIFDAYCTRPNHPHVGVSINSICTVPGWGSTFSFPSSEPVI